MAYTAAVIGAGPNPDNPSADGYAMGYSHADGYQSVENVELVAVADIVPENAQAFASTYGIPDDGVFEDYERMVTTVEPDVVSVCVPPNLHAEISIDCIRSGAVQAVHCEKPMAKTWGDARRMAQEATRRDVFLTFNHQRRFGRPFRRAKELLAEGEIGDLEHVEFSAPNIYDYGSHSFDLCNYYADHPTPEWVLAGVDYRETNRMFGAHNENHAVVQWKYENGLTGLATTGFGSATINCHNRLVGSDGVIEIGQRDESVETTLRVRRDGEGWEPIDTDGEGLHGEVYIHRAIADVVKAIETDDPSELCAENALDATEIIFGAWESVRQRGRVEFPLEIDDNPLEAMVESGALSPEQSE